MFKWVMPIEGLKVVIYKLKGSPITATILDDLKNVMIGGYSGDAAAIYLKLRGFQVDEASTDSINPSVYRSAELMYGLHLISWGRAFQKKLGSRSSLLLLCTKNKWGLLAIRILTTQSLPSSKKV